MTETAEIEADAPKSGSRLFLAISAVLALAGAGGGFFAIYSGMLFPAEAHESAGADNSHETQDAPLPDIGFVKVDPLLISFPPGSSSRHLRFSANLEVPSDHMREVEAIMPRVLDVLNGYLRALEPADFERPAALLKLRAQLLRRIQIVTGSGRVNDLLISEFVLN